MKRIGFVIVLFFISCKKEVVKENILNDTVIENNHSKTDKKNKKFNLHSKELFREKIQNEGFSLKYINTFDFHKDTISIINKNYIMMIGINDNSYNEMKFNPPIFKSINNFDYIFDFYKSSNENYIIQNYNSIISYNKKSNKKNNAFFQKNIIYSFFNNENSLLCDYKSVKLLNKKFEIKDSINIDFIDNFFIKSNSGFSYFESTMDSLYSFSVLENKIKLTKENPLQNIKEVNNIDDFNFSLITENYIIGFDYSDRSNLYFFDRKSYKLKGKVFLNKEFIFERSMLEDEEGMPNLKIIQKNNILYVLGIDRNKNMVLFRVSESNGSN